MQRQDINVDATYGEVNTIDNLTNKVIYQLNYLSDIESTKLCFGEVIVSPSWEVKFIEGVNIHILIPYIPVDKQMCLRFRLEDDNENGSFIINKTNNEAWFPICLPNESDHDRKICVCEFPCVNDKGVFQLLYQGGQLMLYSGNDTDFQIKASLKQNEVFLLKAFASNLYQHPTTGVGLIEFLHGNFENNGLATKLQKEFENDKMVILNAYMDSASGELFLEVKEKDGEI